MGRALIAEFEMPVWGGGKDRAGDPAKVSAVPPEAPEPCLTELTQLGFLWASGPLGRREQPFLKDAVGGGGVGVVGASPCDLRPASCCAVSSQNAAGWVCPWLQLHICRARATGSL